MMKSTKRALTEPCPDPECNAKRLERCFEAAPYVHPARRNLFWIDTGKKKTANERKLHLSLV